MEHRHKTITCIYVAVFVDSVWHCDGWLGDDDGKIDVHSPIGGKTIAELSAEDLPPGATVCCSLSANHTFLPREQELSNAAFIERFGFKVCFLDIMPWTGRKIGADLGGQLC